MIRVLQVVNDMHRAGLETMLMNYYRNIDRTKIQFDFLTHRPYRSDYDDEIESLGGKIYYAPRLYPQNYPIYFKWMKKFFQQHPEYQIIHSHIDTMSYLPLLAAKKSNIPVRIAHSHSTSIDKDFKYLLKKFYKSRINSVATNCLACGEEAGKFLFKKRNFIVIPNAVEASKYYYNFKLRELKRRELGISEQFVVGHVGRFCYPKNHGFLIDIFEQVLKKKDNAVLMLVGTGEKETEIKEYVNKLGLDDKVKFLGNRCDVDELYQVMDVFVLPSLFEGVPLVGVEAQFADLPCFFSDNIPTEVKFSDKCHFISLNKKVSEWASDIVATSELKRYKENENLKNSNFDINNAHKLLEKIYFDLEK